MNDLVLLRQFIKFCAVGAANTVLGCAIVLALMLLADAHYAIANLLGLIFGLIVGFFLHRSFTFSASDQNKEHHSQVAKYVCVFLAAYLIQFAFLAVSIEQMGVSALTGQLLACSIYSVASFIGHKFLTFAPPPFR